ncbi:MAG: O-antigen ligase family protein [Burkholderiales bacterium]
MAAPVAEAAPPSRWSLRSLDVARGAAIVALLAVPVSTALVSTACGVLLLSLLASGRLVVVVRDAFRQPLGRAIVIFFAVVALGMLYGDVPWRERIDSLWSWRKLVYGFLLLGLFGAIAWKRRAAWAMAAFCAAGVIASFLAKWGALPSRPNHEPGVLFQNHTTQGMVFAVGIVCCVFLLSSSAPRVRLALGGVALILAANILFVSPGRSAYLVLAVIPVMAGIWRFGMARAPAVLAGVIVLCAGAYVISPLVRDRVDLALHEVTTHREAAQLTSVGFRAVVYANTLELVRARPITGYGTGSFRQTYTEHVRARYHDWRGEGTTDPHNQFLLVAMETGLIGLAAFLGVIVAGFRQARGGDVYAWIGATVLAGWVLSSLFNSHFRTFGEGHMLALMLGTMLARPTPVRDAGGAPMTDAG